MCPTCHERFDVRLTAQPQSVACTFCQARISIPSHEAAHKHWLAERQAAAPAIEEYQIAKPDDQKAARGKMEAAGGASDKRADGPSDALALVACPTCRERMRVPPGESPTKIPCSFCGTPVPVPSREAFARWKAKRLQTQPKEVIGEYTAAAPVERVTPRMHLFDKLAEVYTEAPIPPPRWTFFSGVFTFPWRKGALFSWTALAVGFTVLSLLGGFLISGGVGTGPRGIGVIGMGFFGLPILWVTIFTFAYAADCCLCVVESTSYGLDDIETWPDGTWREWMPKLVYLIWIAAIPTVVSAGVGKLAEFGGLPSWPVRLGMLFILYPIAFLSALESTSPWVPLTLPIVRTLYLIPGSWLTFYLLTALMAALLTGLLIAFQSIGIVAMIPFGPILAACVLIYARLVGRLGWKISQVLAT